MTEEMKKLQTTQRRMMRMMIQTKRQTGKNCPVAQAASVDVTADVEPPDPDSEQGDDTTEHSNHDLNEHEESSHDTDSNLLRRNLKRQSRKRGRTLRRKRSESNAQSV